MKLVRPQPVALLEWLNRLRRNEIIPGKVQLAGLTPEFLQLADSLMFFCGASKQTPRPF